MSRLIKMRILSLVTIAVIALTSCSVYKNSTSASISIGELNIGMNKETILAKYGQPFSFNIQISNNDTIAILLYKSPKPVANCEFIVTTKLLFINNKLKNISQSDFYVPESVILWDSTKVLLKDRNNNTKD
ncbi:putative uncharacterized protein [Bacteroides sp. CAG:530]|nr:putative uncharacterized protein [Bacteroides sp. CAG:530]